MSLFKTVPDNFFSLLASPNKSIYFDCLVIAFNAYEDASILGVDKKHIVELISDYLDNLQEKLIQDEDEEEADDSQSKAYQILRKFEYHGWIDTDVNNDYEELINFRDYSITVIEALMNIKTVDYEDYSIYDTDPTIDFKGYIYTIYSLLMNKDTGEYGFIIDSVYKNTKMFMRELRKLDIRMKDYIKAIVDTSEIKDLMENLLSYKVELFDKTYHKLKTSENINKYRLSIVNNLNEIVSDSSIIENIATSYRYASLLDDKASIRAMQDIYEIIDLFNGLDNFITEIDKKNKVYLNSTIGKIQFLLNEEADISGKLNQILKFVSNSYKQGKINDAIKTISPLYNLNSMKSLNQNSLYTQRGEYKKFEPATLDMSKKEMLDLDNTFFNEYKSIYSEDLVYKFTIENMVDNVFKASRVLRYEAELDEILMVLFALIYADQSRNLKVRRLIDEEINHKKYILKDFEIYVEEN